MTVTDWLVVFLGYPLSGLISWILASDRERRRIVVEVVRRAEISESPVAAKHILDLLPFVLRQDDATNFWLNNEFKAYQKINAAFAEWCAREGEQHFANGDYDLAIYAFKEALRCDNNTANKKVYYKAVAMKEFTCANGVLRDGDPRIAESCFTRAQALAADAGYEIPGLEDFFKKLHAALTEFYLKEAKTVLATAYFQHVTEAKNHAGLAGTSDFDTTIASNIEVVDKLVGRGLDHY